MKRRAVAIGLAIGIAIGLGAVAVGIADAQPARTSAAAPARTSAAAPARTSAAAPARTSAAAPARLFVNAKEFSLILSRQTVKPGAAWIQLYNGGEDAHDLPLERVGGTRVLRVHETAPGDVTELRTILRRGRWKLWCSLPGHAKAGMWATLVVRR